MLISRGKPPIYDRAALELTEDEKAALIAEEKPPHYRFLLEDKPIEWEDMIRGTVRFEGTHMSDPVLIRADGVPLYTFCSVVDDVEFGTTHILRGEDHVSNTAVQAQIFEALGADLPVCGHMALIKTKDGELSKRKGGGDIRSLREDGLEPMTINSYLAKIGTSDAIDVFMSMEALQFSFEIEKFGRAAAMYDSQELERLNQKYVSHFSFEAVKERLPKGATPEFWEMARQNIKKVEDVKIWWKVMQGIHNHLEPEDAEFIQQASEVLPQEPWDENTWKDWTKTVSEKTGRKGKDLFMPLRRALTGMNHGPELGVLLPLLGRATVVARLAGKADA
jgi:glutamyl-tRNA synthetase